MSRRPLAILIVLLAAGCGAPQAGVTIEGGSGGVRVAPSVSGSLGGLSVSVRG
jgi:hypothetical protein